MSSHSLQLQGAAAGDGAVAEIAPVPEEKKRNAEEDDLYLVQFAKPVDKENPQDWPIKRKWIATTILSATGFTRIMVSTMMAPALTTIAGELDMSSTESAMSLSVFLLATAFGPLLIGPMSELYGRQPILHASNVWFLAWNITCGFAKTKGVLITARLFAGLGASAVYALGGGVLGDLWSAQQRGKTLGLYLLIPLLASAIGPILGGFMTQGATWRWMFWSTSIAQAVMIVIAMVFFSETYAPLILQRRAARLRANTRNSAYYTALDRQHGDRTAGQIIRRHASRPIRMIMFQPVLQYVNISAMFNYGVLYIILTTYSDLWTSRYGESTLVSGLHYLAPAFGELFGSQVGGFVMDWTFARLTRKRGRALPEYHLALLIPSTIISTVGLLMYGWSAQARAPWPVVDLGVFICLFGGQIRGQSTQAYVVDSYADHVSSANSALQFGTSMSAFAFPLFAPTMYRTMGYGWGNTVLGLVGLVTGVVVAVPLWFNGAKMRAKASGTY